MCIQALDVKALAALVRYVTLARNGGVTPVILLTKADLCADPALAVILQQHLQHQIHLQRVAVADLLG